jgi:amino acid transporter
MEFAVVLASLVIALLLTFVFSAVYRSDGGAWSALWTFFALIFLFGLAGGLWMRPYGPVYWGIPWIGIIVWAVLISLLLAFAARPRTPRRPTTTVVDGAEEAQDQKTALNAFFWVLIALLLIAIVLAFTAPRG